MSASIRYRPVNPEAYTSVECYGSFEKALREAFGEFPFVLSNADMKILHGIKACGYIGADELMDAIKEHGAIEVVVEY